MSSSRQWRCIIKCFYFYFRNICKWTQIFRDNSSSAWWYDPVQHHPYPLRRDIQLIWVFSCQRSDHSQDFHVRRSGLDGAVQPNTWHLRLHLTKSLLLSSKLIKTFTGHGRHSPSLEVNKGHYGETSWLVSDNSITRLGLENKTTWIRLRNKHSQGSNTLFLQSYHHPDGHHFYTSHAVALMTTRCHMFFYRNYRSLLSAWIKDEDSYYVNCVFNLLLHRCWIWLYLVVCFTLVGHF